MNDSSLYNNELFYIFIKNKFYIIILILCYYRLKIIYKYCIKVFIILISIG